MKNNTTQRGSLVLEVLLTLGIGVIFSLAVGALIGANSKLTTASELKGQAAAYAKETMEQVFAMKYDDWSNLTLTPGEEYYRIVEQSGNLVLQVETALPDGEAIDSTFSRLLQITPGHRDALGKLSLNGVDDDQVRHATVTVSWHEGDLPKTEQLETFLTHWK
ncbi:MAG: hypothetical protein WCV86_02100 [Patescibacteria group bacterium]|jgi:hypothetical protein